MSCCAPRLTELLSQEIHGTGATMVFRIINGTRCLDEFWSPAFKACGTHWWLHITRSRAHQQTHFWILPWDDPQHMACNHIAFTFGVPSLRFTRSSDFVFTVVGTARPIAWLTADQVRAAVAADGSLHLRITATFARMEAPQRRTHFGLVLGLSGPARAVAGFGAADKIQAHVQQYAVTACPHPHPFVVCELPLVLGAGLSAASLARIASVAAATGATASASSDEPLDAVLRLVNPREQDLLWAAFLAANVVATTNSDTSRATVSVLPVDLWQLVASYISTRYRVGDTVRAQDCNGRWLLADVVDVGPDAVRVHYHNWLSQWDETIRYSDERLLPRHVDPLHAAPSLPPSPLPPPPPPCGGTDAVVVVVVAAAGTLPTEKISCCPCDCSDASSTFCGKCGALHATRLQHDSASLCPAIVWADREEA